MAMVEQLFPRIHPACSPTDSLFFFSSTCLAIPYLHQKSVVGRMFVVKDERIRENQPLSSYHFP